MIQGRMNENANVNISELLTLTGWAIEFSIFFLAVQRRNEMSQFDHIVICISLVFLNSIRIKIKFICYSFNKSKREKEADEKNNRKWQEF